MVIFGQILYKNTLILDKKLLEMTTVCPNCAPWRSNQEWRSICADTAYTIWSYKKWPYKKGNKVKLFILAGHRNMEGERAFIQELKELKGSIGLLNDNPEIAFKYSLGGAYHVSNEWEPMGLTGYYDTFGPELSFSNVLADKLGEEFAVAKFTHSGSQIIDWTPEGSMAKSRHIYPKLVGFIREAIMELEARGNKVELGGIFYHLGENDMSFHPYRRQAAERLKTIIAKSREDLGQPDLKWYVSQQPPTDDKRVNNVDVVADVSAVAAADPNIIHVKVFELPPQEKKIVITTEGIVRIGEQIAEAYLSRR